MTRTSHPEHHPESLDHEPLQNEGFDSPELQTTRELLQRVYRERSPQEGDSVEFSNANESNDEYIDPAVADRLERSRSAGEILSHLSSLSSVEELTPEMIHIAKAQLEKRKWRDSFEGINPGDTVMILTEPADKIFSLKTFNDKILGQQQTDTMIGLSRSDPTPAKPGSLSVLFTFCV